MTSNEQEPSAHSEQAAEVAGEVIGQEPAKKHGDPLLHEVEGGPGPADASEGGGEDSAGS